MKKFVSLDFIPPQGGSSMSQTCYADSIYDKHSMLEIFKIHVSENTGGGIYDKSNGIIYTHIAVSEEGIPFIYDVYEKKTLGRLSYLTCTIDGKLYSR